MFNTTGSGLSNLEVVELQDHSSQEGEQQVEPQAELQVSHQPAEVAIESS